MGEQLTRLPDWSDRLDQAIESFRGVKFRLGKADCGIFTATCIEAMTGMDFKPLIEGKYGSKSSLAKFLRDECGGYVGTPPWRFFALYVAPKIFAEPIVPEAAVRGDVCVANDQDVRPAMGIVTSNKLAAFMTENGVDFINTGRIYRAWAL